MAVTIPVPRLGSVNVLTGSRDSIEVICTEVDSGQSIYNIEEGTLLSFRCGTSSVTLVAYLANLDDLSLTQIISALLNLNVQNVQAENQLTIIIPPQ